ncbi:MAG: DUF465 domain-containing protein [Hyphomicrobiaceae bacterium]
MTQLAHPIVKRLMRRKDAIEARISEELMRPLPDMLTLQGLKRARLSLKDRIAHAVKTRTYEVLPNPIRIR